jgi:tetratricopeptide (TPR) repeat protein
MSLSAPPHGFLTETFRLPDDPFAAARVCSVNEEASIMTTLIRRSLFYSLISIAFVSAYGQDSWTWPEKPKNLQVLTDFSGQELRPVMTGFSRALGVRCTHCHVGEEGKPLSTYDFASDANLNKDRAREMLRMLTPINEHLAKIQPSGPKRVNMWCHTCHAGRPRPATLEEELNEAYTRAGVTAAVARYRDLREKFYGKAGYDFSESSLNGFAYGLIAKKDFDGAIAIFRLNASQYPQSGNVWDSLAEAYLAAGKNELGEIYYRKSLEIDPQNDNALKKLGEIEGKGRVQ